MRVPEPVGGVGCDGATELRSCGATELRNEHATKGNEMSGSAQIDIRRVVPGEVDAVGVLFDLYRQFYECPADLDFARAYLRARIDADESVVFAAWNEAGEAVGFTQLYPTFCSVEGGRIFVLYDLFVDPSARVGGVGNALMQAAEEYARSQGALRMDLSTAKTNTRAQSVYEGRGWQRDEVFFHYELPLAAAS